MKPRTTKKRIHALTRMEVLVIIIVLAVLAIIFLPPFNVRRRRQNHAENLLCKQP
jgi:Tfp pilus assembly protein FimT